MIKFPYSKPEITNTDKDAVLDVLKNGYLTQGEKLQEFEAQLQKTFKSNNVIACNSGTAALHLIYSTLGLGPEAGLLTSPITFLATASAARMCNAPVIFADVDSKSGLLTPNNIEKALVKSKFRIKVITVVHLGGKVCDMEGIAEVARKYGCLVVEDACHAPGGNYYKSDKKKSVIGSCEYSVASTFSFHAIKHIAMGEGGCVSTNDDRIANKIKEKRSHGMIRDQDRFSFKFKGHKPWYYEMKELGWNYRVDELSCALGLSQLRRLYSGIEKRKKIAQFYYNELCDVKQLLLPSDPAMINQSVWHLYSILINFNEIGISRGTFMMKLADFGIGSQVHYIPLFYQPYFKDNPKNFIGAVSYYNSTLSLPIYVGLKNKDIKYIANSIKSIIDD
jgi:dTDP-4-amino-4,6-dideoxygalactose transaminase